MMDKMAARVVIGLDFGTTYSGVAYCDNNGAREGTAGVKLITSWPGHITQNATNEFVLPLPDSPHDATLGIAR